LDNTAKHGGRKNLLTEEAEGRELRAKSKEQRAKSKGQRAKGKGMGQRAGSKRPGDQKKTSRQLPGRRLA
jgi:hypothetical protein